MSKFAMFVIGCFASLVGFAIFGPMFVLGLIVAICGWTFVERRLKEDRAAEAVEQKKETIDEVSDLLKDHKWDRV